MQRQRPRIALNKGTTPTASTQQANSPIKPKKQPVAKLRMHPRPEDLLDMQFDLGTDYSFIEIDIDITPPAVGDKIQARLMETAHCDCYDVTVDKPKDGVFTLDAMVEQAKAEVIAGLLDEGELVAATYYRLLQGPATGLEQVGCELIGWLSDFDGTLLEIEHPEEYIDLWAEARFCGTSSPLTELRTIEERGGLRFINPDKLPKGLLLTGKPSRTVFTRAVMEDKEAANQYATIVAYESFALWHRQLSKHRSQPLGGAEAIENNLQLRADDARAKRQQAREAAKKAARQKQLERAITLNQLLTSDRVQLSIEHGFDTHEAVEEALSELWLQEIGKELNLAANQISDVAEVSIYCGLYSQDQLADEAPGWVQCTSPTLPTLKLLQALKEYLSENGGAHILLEDREWTISVYEAEGHDFAERIIVDGLLCPRTDEDNRFLSITIKPCV